jgi:hypothetical protein
MVVTGDVSFCAMGVAIINIFQRPVAVCIICLIMIQVFVLSLENSLQHYEKGKKSLGRDSRAGCVEIRGKTEYRRKGRTTNELADFSKLLLQDACSYLVEIGLSQRFSALALSGDDIL